MYRAVMRLPSLTALRAFDAAARNLSFAKAAAELNVTPAALSFQIKQLEEELGSPLFMRLTRKVELTDAGRTLAPYAADAFTTLRRGWSEAVRLNDENRLVITAGPGFAARWLAPHLGRFARLNADVELRIVTTLAMLSFERDGIDLAVRFGPARDEGLFSEPLLDEYVLPVMPPEVAARVSAPPDLHGETLFWDESINFLQPTPDWNRWFAAAGFPLASPWHGPSFSQADHVIDAALEGGGVALARSSMCLDLIRSGRLVAPFPHVLAVAGNFRIVCPPGRENRGPALAFRTFLKEIAENSDDVIANKIVVPAEAPVPTAR